MNLNGRVGRLQPKLAQLGRDVDAHVKGFRVLAVGAHVSLAREDAAQPGIVGVVRHRVLGRPERRRLERHRALVVTEREQRVRARQRVNVDALDDGENGPLGDRLARATLRLVVSVAEGARVERVPRVEAVRRAVRKVEGLEPL
eukprot:5687280-Prymnesium_polylepis.1